MKNTIHSLIASTILCLSIVAQAATVDKNTLIFEQVDPVAEQNRLLEKYAVDKKRTSSAIENTKSQILKSQGKTYLPELYLRLAELYIEKSRISYMEKRVSQGPGGSSLSTLEAEGLKIQAVETYQRILNVYPNFEYRDKVHFYLAHEYKELNKPNDMILEYETLVAKFPKSQYTPEAFLLLADHFVSINQTTKSEQYYRRVLNYTESPARIIARYKLAWVHINRKEFAKAGNLLEQSVRDTSSSNKADIDSYDVLDIRLESLIDLAFIYPDRFKKPATNHAIEYFSDLAWSRQSYLAVLEKLGLRLKVKNLWSSSLAVYRQLAQLSNDPAELISISDSFFEAYDKARSINKTASLANEQDVAALIRAIRFHQASINFTDEEKEKAFTRFETYTRDISTKLQSQAKRTKKIADYQQAAKAYKHYLSFFRETENGLSMQKNYGNSLYNAKDFFGAGKQFEQISQAANLSANQRDTYLYSATQSYFQALESQKSLNLYKTTQARAGLIAAGQLHLRDFPNSKYAQKIQFNIAWTKYNEGRFNEAATMFQAFVLKYPGHALADPAVETIIDAYQVMEDYASLQKVALELANNTSLSSKNRQELSRVARVAQFKVISAMTASALDNWDDGKIALLEYAEQHESSALGEQALLSLIATSQEKNDLETLQQSASNFIRKYPGSDQAANTAKMLIDTQLRSVQFRPLIDSLANYAVIDKKEGKAFLFQAAQLSGRMGNGNRANRLFEKWMSDYKISSAELGSATLTMVKNDLSRGDTDTALKTALAYRKKIPSSQRMPTDALAGLMFAESNELTNATKLYQAVLQSSGRKLTKDTETNRYIAELGIRVSQPIFKNYQQITLANGIDTKLIEKKSAMLGQLETDYQMVMGYKSAEQSAKALLMLSAVNEDFAGFLMDAPIPVELSDEDRKEYVNLISQQAEPYQATADEYKQAAFSLINERGFLNASLNTYQHGVFIDESFINKPTFAKPATSVVGFTDQILLAEHEKVMALPTQFDGRLDIITSYIEAQDYGQALLITQSSLEQISQLKPAQISALKNISGVVLLNMGHTDEGFQMFQEALDTHAGNMAARANISALLLSFNATNAANTYIKKLPPGWNKDIDDTTLIDLVEQHKRQFD